MQSRLSACAASAVMIAVAGSAFGQAFNVDLGANTTYPIPSPSFGGAAGQVGVWNAVDATSAVATPLVAASGAVTGATLAHTGGNGNFQVNNPGTTGDDQRLLDDVQDLGGTGGTSTWTFSGLAPGNYSVYVYAWAPDSPTLYLTDVTVAGGAAGTQTCGGGTFPGYALGVTHVVDSTSSYGALTLTVATNTGFGSVNGFQLAPLPCDGSPLLYCTAKVNSLGCAPAIASTGTPSATAGSGFVVRGTNVINNKSGLLFYGSTGQTATPFQNGTLCVKSPIKRTPAVGSGGNPPPNDCSGVYAIDMNTFAVGGLGGAPLPALTVPGTVVDCQWWGRDPGFAAPNNTTLTNGLQYVVCN
jgi:hypothetical protein